MLTTAKNTARSLYKKFYPTQSKTNEEIQYTIHEGAPKLSEPICNRDVIKNFQCFYLTENRNIEFKEGIDTQVRISVKTNNTNLIPDSFRCVLNNISDIAAAIISARAGDACQSTIGRISYILIKIIFNNEVIALAELDSLTEQESRIADSQINKAVTTCIKGNPNQGSSGVSALTYFLYIGLPLITSAFCCLSVYFFRKLRQSKEYDSEYTKLKSVKLKKYDSTFPANVEDEKKEESISHDSLTEKIFPFIESKEEKTYDVALKKLASIANSTGKPAEFLDDISFGPIYSNENGEFKSYCIRFKGLAFKPYAFLKITEAQAHSLFDFEEKNILQVKNPEKAKTPINYYRLKQEIKQRLLLGEQIEIK